MLKKIISRLLAAVLCVTMALGVPAAALADIAMVSAEDGSAQAVVTLGDGSQTAIPVDAVVTSLGETVFWIDSEWLSEDVIAALASGVIELWDMNGNLLAQYDMTPDAVTG